MIVKWKASYFCSYQQRLYSILVCKSAIRFGISPREVLEQKRDVFTSFSLYSVKMRKYPSEWKASYFCSYQQRLYSILVCKSAIRFGISPREVLEQKRDVFTSFSLYSVKMRKYPSEWKASYFCSYQQRLYSILVCKSAIRFGISPREVLEQKRDVQNILTLLQTVFRIQIDSKLMFSWSISRVLSKKKGFSFFGLTDFEIWQKIGIKWKITLLMIVKWKGVLFLLLPTTTILHSSM
jgi:flavodoxin